MKILLTGGSGHLGKELVKDLTKQGHHIFLLTRPKSFERVKKLYESNERVQLITGDITDSQVLLEHRDVIEKVLEETELVFHAAAYYDLEGDQFKHYFNNVIGTQNVLSLLEKMSKKPEFHYISTIAVTGNFYGTFFEDDLDRNQTFYDFYAESKFKAEKYVRDWNEVPDIKKRIYRLGILLGDSATGEMGKVDGPYYFFQFLKKMKKYSNYLDRFLKFIPFPCSEVAFFPVIPVDEASKALALMVSHPHPTKELKCYHLFSPGSPKVKDFVTDTFRHLDLHGEVVTIPRTQINNKVFRKINLPSQTETYLYGECEYNQSEMKKDFPFLILKNYQNYKKEIFSYLDDKNNNEEK